VDNPVQKLCIECVKWLGYTHLIPYLTTLVVLVTGISTVYPRLVTKLYKLLKHQQKTNIHQAQSAYTHYPQALLLSLLFNIK